MIEAAPRRMLLRNGLHVDGSGPDPVGIVDVLIEGARIREVSDRPIVDPGARQIDLGGRSIMPGLIDCHVHATIFETELQQLVLAPPSLTAIRAAGVLRGMLERGFTSVRDAAGADWGLKAAVEQGHVAGPRLFISGRAISQTGGHGDFRRRTEGELCGCSNALRLLSRISDGCDEVRHSVREELRQGADQIKIMASGGLSAPHDRLQSREFSLDEIKTAVEEADARGTYVMAHAYTADAIRHALQGGVRSIEHGNLIDSDTAAIAAAKGAFVVPTLVTYWLPADAAPEAAAPWLAAALRDLLENGLEAIGICKQAGVALGFGTDLFGDMHERQNHEFLIRREVQPAHEIIASATRVNAEILQQRNQLGALIPGALADILVVDGNPLQDISLLARPAESLALIMKDGIVFKNSIA
jgi:imidazolonepropionase-like amidohydrolase